MKLEYPLLLILCLCVWCTDSKKSRRKARDFKTNRKSNKKGDPVKNINDVIGHVCMPRGRDRLVYRFRNNTHIFVGFDVLEECTVYSMTWKIHKGNYEVLEDRGSTQYDVQPSAEVRRFPEHYLLAAAGPRQQTTFQQSMGDCMASLTTTSCLMEAFAKTALKMRKVQFSDQCKLNDSHLCREKSVRVT